MQDTPREDTRQVVVDLAELRGQLQGDLEVLRCVVRESVSEVEEHLSALPRDLANARWAEVERRAHSVKSAMRLVHARPAQELAQRLEGRAPAHASGEAEALLVALQRECGPVCAALHRFLDGEGATPR